MCHFSALSSPLQRFCWNFALGDHGHRAAERSLTGHFSLSLSLSISLPLSLYSCVCVCCSRISVKIRYFRFRQDIKKGFHRLTPKRYRCQYGCRLLMFWNWIGSVCATNRMSIQCNTLEIHLLEDCTGWPKIPSALTL